MTERVPLPAELVSTIKGIIRQDKRERTAAGFRYGTIHLADRIAEHFGLSIHTVRSIKEHKRRRRVWANEDDYRGVTIDPGRLAALRMRRERSRSRRQARAKNAPSKPAGSPSP
jgi:hypothetical protein